VNRLAICSNESSKSVKPEELEQSDFFTTELLSLARMIS
jgi:hypothetical protein